MPDIWATITAVDSATQERLADVLEVRGADPQQQEMRRTFLGDIPFPTGARVLEVGCGTGVLTRVLARWPDVAEVVGVDPSPVFLARARDLAAGLPNLTFREGDGHSLPVEDAAFDVVVFDSTLTHLPGRERALAEALRVLRPAGILAAFDGDYTTTTVALGEHDPLQVCVDMMMAHSVDDRLLVRRLPGLIRAAGFEFVNQRSHGFVETTEGGYMLTVVDRGADFLAAAEIIGAELAAAFKTEARRRVDAGIFFGHIAYASLIARKPG